jgi:multidrug transporter EmrE-like cation transporter
VLHYWASHDLLLSWAFLLPSFVNYIAAFVFIFAASWRPFSWTVAVVLWLSVLASVLMLILFLVSDAVTLEMPVFTGIAHAVFATIGLVLFYQSFDAVSFKRFNKDDWWDEGDSDDDGWDDDDPEPWSPMPTGPSAGLTLQTRSSRITWSVS